MKSALIQHITTALNQLYRSENGSYALPSVQIERTKDEKNGDFASNIALVLAKAVGTNPRELAAKLIQHLPSDPNIARVEIAGPGFINFFLSDSYWQSTINTILDAGKNYGCNTINDPKKIHIEFVSSNPTGPLHVGHGRGASYGASLSNMLEAVGHIVHREYYINDAGRQMDILATSVWLRYLELNHIAIIFPTNGYRGEYIMAIAAKLLAQVGTELVRPLGAIYDNVPVDETETGGDKEAHIDGIIANAKNLLGTDYQKPFQLALTDILRDMREDLAEFGVEYNEWFSEQSLVENGAIDRALATLQERGYLYEKEGATWFACTQFGDDKDRVLVRANGQRTYFANDIAYHLSKLERGFDKIIDVLGADHHGYITRITAVLEALANRGKDLEVPLIQFVSLYRGKEKVPMSTRAGEFITLRELRHEVGNDAARFFYIQRKADQAMDFDLELAKSKSNENPVYYIQYAHARICSVFRQAKEKGYQATDLTVHCTHRLVEPQEKQLLKTLARYPELLQHAANQYEPQQLATYLRELANEYHTYYNNHAFLVEDVELRTARLSLIAAVKQVIANGLRLLGVSAPEEM